MSTRASFTWSKIVNVSGMHSGASPSGASHLVVAALSLKNALKATHCTVFESPARSRKPAGLQEPSVFPLRSFFRQLVAHLVADATNFVMAAISVFWHFASALVRPSGLALSSHSTLLVRSSVSAVAFAVIAVPNASHVPAMLSKHSGQLSSSLPLLVHFLVIAVATFVSAFCTHSSVL